MKIQTQKLFQKGQVYLPINIYYSELDYKFWDYLGYINGENVDEILLNMNKRFDYINKIENKVNIHQIELLKYWKKILTKNIDI